MTNSKPTIVKQLKSLLSDHDENEVIEFKEAKTSFDSKRLGKYFSALSNEANLKKEICAWLLFGVNDKKQVVGTNFRPKPKDLNHLKEEIANKTNNRITFIDIHEVMHNKHRVLLFEIPAAPRGIPTSFSGHYYGRDGEALSPLNLEEIERIRMQAVQEDWSAQILANASLDDLDTGAIKIARENYKNKFPDSDVDSWDDKTFLNKAKLTIKGKITRTTILLLGKAESEYLLSEADPKVRWILKDGHGDTRDYAIFGPPLLLAVDKVFSKIRNLKYRYIREGTLFPDEVDQYEPYAIREALNNCIAHQDYTLCGRINVIELDEKLIFTNLGSFVPGDVQRVVIENAPEEHYRNRFLATAMFALKMVDTVGGGIRKMFEYQRKRFFPMPDYNLSKNRVEVTLTGKVIDIAYARALAENNKLTLSEIIALDKVQKKKPLEKQEEKSLKKKSLIEGRKPNFYIARAIAQKVNQKASYSNNKAFDKKYYCDLICKAIKEHGSLTRSDIDELLWKKLSDRLSDTQKKTKVGNLLGEMRRTSVIENKGTMKSPSWILKNP